jgi:hypothetical protein
MNNKKRLMPLIALLIAVIVLSSFVIGYVAGKNSHVAKAAVSYVAYHTNTYVIDDITTCVLPVYVASSNYHWMPTTATMGYSITRTNVHIKTVVVVNKETPTATATPIITTVINTATPTAVITTVPTSTPVPTATATPEPTQEQKQHCDNGVGNGADCNPPGLVNKPAQNNDDAPGDAPGNPNNKGGAKKQIVVPLFLIDALINWCIVYKNKHYRSYKRCNNKDNNHLLDHLLEYTIKMPVDDVSTIDNMESTLRMINSDEPISHWIEEN